MYTVNHEMEVTALMLLGIAGINFSGLRSKPALRSSCGP